MANRIKGITVEIGGDTTKLDKALKGTQDNLSKTKTALKDVERLLKLDPTNTVLLEQKQRLLATAAGDTAKKLDTLREAAKNADAALARGQAYEEKFAPFKQALEDTGTELQRLQKKKETMDAAFAEGKVSGEAYEKFNATLAATQEEYDGLMKRKKELDQEFKGAKMDQSQYDALQRELVETQEEYKRTSREAASCNASLEKIGSTADKVAKKTSTASKVAAAGLTAAGALVGKIVANTADYEQLVGGVETLFKESSEQVLDYANAAYKTAGLNANEYMETVTSFSASLLESLNGNTQAAAGIADMAITDMADNANKMGTEMSRIQDAYQGFAKQNYTMLDNLKLGYGGTKTEMERLLQTAEQLTGYHFDISNFSDVVTAIHAVQEEMGITGTTAKEAEGTITGSINQTKAAIDNWVTGMGQANADIDALTKDVVDSFVTMAGNIIPVLESVWAHLPTAAKVITAVTAVIAVISPIAGLISNVAGAINGVSTIAKLFNATAGNSVYLTFAKWALIIIGVVAALTALIAVINVLLGKSSDMSSTMDNISNVTSGPYRSIAQAQSANTGVRGFASGGVFEPNSPMLAILGDNRQEREVAAPESTLRETFMDTLLSSGLLGNQRTQTAKSQPVVLNIDGKTFARLMMPLMEQENSRLGLKIV